MKVSYSNLVNSKFFNPAFNSAVFDGPLRIYFAQFHESLALKIYFSLQQMHPDFLAQLKTQAKQISGNILIMLYPSAEACLLALELEPNSSPTKTKSPLVTFETLNDDLVVAIAGPFEDTQLVGLMSNMVTSISKSRQQMMMAHAAESQWNERDALTI